IESDLAIAAYTGASRAVGTAGTTPFTTGGDLSDFANVRRVLDDNGAPQSDLHIVVNGASAAALRGKQSLLLKVNESGSDALLRHGSLTDQPVAGMWLHNSAQLGLVA